jgi:precorrin-2 dehydrogenase / sirohydrochlorin ferrochelatase
MSALLPVALDLTRLTVAVIGDGPRAERRAALLHEAGARDIRVFSAVPPGRALSGVAVAFIADLPDEAAEAAADMAREAGALVNVEDVPADCDFQSAAVVRRGDLAVGVWTNGRCPMLARVLRQFLDRLLPADFGRALDRLASERQRLKPAKSGTLVLEAAALRAIAQLNVPSLNGSRRFDA